MYIYSERIQLETDTEINRLKHTHTDRQTDRQTYRQIPSTSMRLTRCMAMAMAKSAKDV